MISGSDSGSRAPGVAPMLWAVASFAAAGLSGWWAWRDLGGAEAPMIAIVVTLLFVFIGWVCVKSALRRLRADPAQFTVRPDVLRPGDEFEATWRMRFRRPTRVPRASLRLIFTEDAVKGSGKHKERFEEETVVQTTEVTDRELGEGEELVVTLRGRIPAGAMHSFDAPDNALSWKVAVNADIKGSPDESDEAGLTVLAEPAA